MKTNKTFLFFSYLSFTIATTSLALSPAVEPRNKKEARAEFKEDITEFRAEREELKKQNHKEMKELNKQYLGKIRDLNKKATKEKWSVEKLNKETQKLANAHFATIQKTRDQNKVERQELSAKRPQREAYGLKPKLSDEQRQVYDQELSEYREGVKEVREERKQSLEEIQNQYLADLKLLEQKSIDLKWSQKDFNKASLELAQKYMESSKKVKVETREEMKKYQAENERPRVKDFKDAPVKEDDQVTCLGIGCTDKVSPGEPVQEVEKNLTVAPAEQSECRTISSENGKISCLTQ